MRQKIYWWIIIYWIFEKENEEIKPNILILNKYNPLNTSNTKIIELNKEIVELLKKTKFFERGYIIDDAIENGWLKYEKTLIIQ